MGVAAAAFDGIYTVICRDPDTGNGGLIATEYGHHKPFFVRAPQGEAIEDIDRADRMVQVVATGFTGQASLSAPEATHWEFGVEVVIGYFAGGYEDNCQRAMLDDFMLIAKALMTESNRPTGTYAYIVEDSNVEPLDDDRYLHSISVTVQVHGSP